MDNEKWHEELNKKSSLEIYKRNKLCIREEPFYDNRSESKIWFKARVNCLHLKDRN